jgi:hypothetical protein
MIVPGGGISCDGSRWIAKRPTFFLPVRVLSKLFRRLMIDKLVAAHAAGQLRFYGALAALGNAKAFAAYLAPLKRSPRTGLFLTRRYRPRGIGFCRLHRAGARSAQRAAALAAISHRHHFRTPQPASLRPRMSVA